MILIALGNRARHGKSGAASAIADHCKKILRPVLHMGWADALRREVTDAITNAGNIRNLLSRGPVSDDGQKYVSVPDWVQPDPNPVWESALPHGKHPLLLQWWGADYRRAQDLDYWVKRGVQTINSFVTKNPNGVVLVSDTRFFNEIYAIKKLGGHTMNVTRLNDDGTPFRDPGRDPNHISETELDNYNWDYRIAVRNGDTALKSELAITIFEYVRGLRGE